MGGGGLKTALLTATLGPVGYLAAQQMNKKSSKVSDSAAVSLAADEEETKKSRKALLETSGGILGEEVSASSGRATLLGN